MAAVERTVTGMGYDLVDAERSAGGLLRVTIDRRHLDGLADGLSDAQPTITVDDCERVTRQLQHVLEVEGCAYERLEVSSPGLDRPLKKAADYRRFAGLPVEVTLKVPFEGRKRYRGELQPAEGDGWRLLLDDDAPTLPLSPSKRSGRPPLAKRAKPAEAPRRALDFSLEEVRDARLVPVLDFKGRRASSPLGADLAATEAATGAAVPDDDMNGGRIQ